MGLCKPLQLFCFLTFLAISMIVPVLLHLFFSYEDVFVDTVYGRVKGFTGKSRDGRTFSQFNSIPYAKPPIGDLRFQPPQKLEKWEGTKDVSSHAYYCPQYDSVMYKKITGNEDCLYLSVYTPHIVNKMEETSGKAKLLPVMVFIHGGYFMFGSMDFYPGNYFMDEEVVLVTVQYRLGALGFLNTGDDVVTGNMGLKDQNAALQWVQKSIEDFGGDPSRVTIFGESAGAASVHHQVMSKKSHGLFRFAIAQSASSLCPWTYTRNPKKQSVHLGKLLKCPTENSQELVSCLRNLKAEEIVEIHKSHESIFQNPIEFFGPSIETKTEKNKDTIFLDQSPYKMAVVGKYFNKIPMIFGFNSEDGCLRSAAITADEERLTSLSEDWNSAGKHSLFLHDKGTPENLEKIWKYYFQSSVNSKLSISNYKAITDLYSDTSFTKCTRDAAILHSKTNSSTYLYYFTYKNQMSFGGIIAAARKDYPFHYFNIAVQYIKEIVYKWIGWETMDYGVCHIDEVAHLFPIIFMGVGKNSKDCEFSKRMITLWTTFAKEGRPGGVKDVDWTPISLEENNPQYLNLGTEMKMIDDPLRERMNFWKTLKPPRNLEPELENQYEYL